MSEKFSTKVPPCAKWNIWLGREIEGYSQLGTLTLFVRRIPSDITTKHFAEIVNQGITRVWFCKEFTDWDKLTEIAPMFLFSCLEATLETFAVLPPALKSGLVRIYLKIPVELRPGDHVCVGPAFADESFVIGSGNKVTPEEYESDVFIA